MLKNSSVKKNIEKYRILIQRLGNSFGLRVLIASENAYGHLLSVHNRTGPDVFIGETWPCYGILQGPKTTDVEQLGDVLLANHHPFRPLYAQETLWSGNQHGHPDYSDDELRKNAFTICMSAAALNFSDNGGPTVEEIGNSSSGFSGTLELDDRRQWRGHPRRASVRRFR